MGINLKNTGIINFKDKNITYNFVKEQHVNEPISDNIYNAINDYYNLMYLIKNSWLNKKFILKMYGAGYNIYGINDELQAWIGAKEKYECLMFIIFYGGMLYDNAQKNFKGTMEVFDFDEDMWIYSKLNFIDILKGKKARDQKEIIKK